MIKIPNQTKKHSISNGSDLFGTINYGRNLNLDEPGYIKLASRVVSMFNEASTADIRLPVAFGRNILFQSPEDSVDFAITQTAVKGFWLTLLVNGITLNEDSGLNAPTLTTDSHGRWFQNLWHVTDDTELYTKAGVGDSNTYTPKSASLSSGKVHCIEVFRNRNTIAVSNGNTVKQFDSSYAASNTLTIPSDFEVCGMAYSNQSMGVIAMFSDTTTGKNQNQEAYFFVWDGSATSAGPAVPIGSSKPIAVTAYKGSWVILTRNGQLRYYNGGGWTDLATLPHYHKNLTWGKSFTRDLLGDVLFVEGDRIYLNMNALYQAYGSKYEQYLASAAGGILCYDPAVGGIYHRYAPSISPACELKVAQADVSTSTDIMSITVLAATVLSSAIPPTGSPVKYVYDKTSVIGGLTPNTIYYVIKHNATQFSLAASATDATNGVKVDLTSTGAANNYFFGFEIRDYGTSYANTSGAIASVGAVNPIWNHLIFGAELNDYNGTGNSNHLCITSPDFPNRGYFVTPKMQSQGITDKGQKIYVKYRTLDTNDSIVVKVKSKDILGLPVSTPQATSSTVNQCAWTSTTVFTSTANLSAAKTAFDAGYELECEVIAGAGAGTLTKISNLTYSTGTYTVTLAEAPDGATASRYCDVVIENWRVLGTITTSDVDGYKTFGIDSTSTWHKFKVELRGANTTVEEINFINSEAKPAD